MNGKMKLGFVGCGGQATYSLYPVISLIPEIDLVAACDLKEELAIRNARNFGAKKWYTDLNEMLSKERLDGVAIVGPPRMHYEVGKKCLDAGLPIFVEKPSAISYKEALDLAEYAEAKGSFGAVAFMKRQSTCYRLAKAISEKGEFGKINEIEVRFANGRYPDLNERGWKLDVEGPPYSFLIGQAVHIFDLIRFFCGDAAEIYASLNEVDSGIFGYAITIRFKNDSIGVLNINALQGPEFQMSEYFLAAGYECWLEVKDMVSLNVLSNLNNKISSDVLNGKDLTNREKQVLKLIGEGKCNKEIASDLSISVRTVEFHRGRIMRKLEVDGVVGLVKSAINLGLTTL